MTPRLDPCIKFARTPFGFFPPTYQRLIGDYKLPLSVSVSVKGVCLSSTSADLELRLVPADAIKEVKKMNG